MVFPTLKKIRVNASDSSGRTKGQLESAGVLQSRVEPVSVRSGDLSGALLCFFVWERVAWAAYRKLSVSFCWGGGVGRYPFLSLLLTFIYTELRTVSFLRIPLWPPYSFYLFFNRKHLNRLQWFNHKNKNCQEETKSHCGFPGAAGKESAGRGVAGGGGGWGGGGALPVRSLVCHLLDAVNIQ